MQQAAESLKTFAQGLLAQVHAVVVKPEAATREELREVCSSSMQSFMEEIVN
jgi:hypothetical protein